jgi:hypothetical protein
VILIKKLTIHGAKGLSKSGDIYCVASIGRESFTTDIDKDTIDPVWDAVWEVYQFICINFMEDFKSVFDTLFLFI